MRASRGRNRLRQFAAAPDRARLPIEAQLRYIRRVDHGPKVKSDPHTPCGDCPHAPSCAATGQMCAAFATFVSSGFTSKRWRLLPRVPSVEITAHYQQLHERQTALDLKCLAKLAKRQARRGKATNSSRESVAC